MDASDVTAIDEAQLCRMVDAFLEQGFTYFDTAYPYHKQTSEGAIRKALVERHPRESYLLADKMPTFLVKGPEDYPKFFRSSWKGAAWNILTITCCILWGGICTGRRRNTAGLTLCGS